MVVVDGSSEGSSVVGTPTGGVVVGGGVTLSVEVDVEVAVVGAVALLDGVVDGGAVVVPWSGTDRCS